MAFSIPADELDPLVVRVGELTGLVEPNGSSLEINFDWFTSPGPELKKAFSPERHDALKGLLEALLGSTNAQTLGVPDASAEATWYPIRDADGNETGIYITVAVKGAALVFGVGVRWNDSPTDLDLAAWIHAPLLKVTEDDVDFVMGHKAGSETFPVDIAFEVTRQTGRFGTDDLGFSGLRLGAHIFFTDVPEFSFIFLDLQLPDGQPASDRSLLDLSDIAAGEWVNMLVSLFAAQLQNIAGDDVAAIREHLLPLLGFGNDVPSFRWEQLGQPGSNILRDWLKDLAASQTYLQDWLGHLAGLLEGAAVTVEGTGTRANPYRACVDLGSGVNLCVTLARTTNTDGSYTLYPGILLQAPSQDVGGGVRLSVESALELMGITLTASPQVEGITAFDARMRLFRNGGPLVSKDFTGEAEPLNHLGNLSVGELRAGLKLNAVKQPEPMLELHDVTYLRGAYPVLDLSSSDKMLDVLEQAAGDTVTTVVADLVSALVDALGANSGDHAGRHIAALMGLVDPPTFTGGAWAIPLATVDVPRFLGNPLRAIGCYHVACLEAGQWQVMLQELAALLHHASVPAPALSGSGTLVDPWRVILFDDSGSRAALEAHHESAGGGNGLAINLVFEPDSVDFGAGVALHSDLQISVLALDLPSAAACSTPSAAMTTIWLLGVSVGGRLIGTPHLSRGEVAGLELRAGQLQLAAAWTQQDGLDWSASIANVEAIVSGGSSLTFPAISFDDSFDLASLGDLFRLVLGSWLIERGGFSGFGVAGLLGLLPDMPNIDLPTLPDWSTGPLALPADWPTFSVTDWPAFFSDPWPGIKLHIAGLFRNPEWVFPALRWLGASLHGLLPDLTLPDLGFPDGGSSFPELDFSIRGDGTYESPYAVSVNEAGGRNIELLVWLDPDGPDTGGMVNAALSWLPPQLRDLASLSGSDITNAQLVELLRVVSLVDAHLRDALHGVLDADIEAALDTLTLYLTNSDGIVLVDSQQPDEPGATGWNTPQNPASLPEAHHGAQLSHPDILTAIQNQIASLSTDAPVLLLGAAWEARDVWEPLLTGIGSSLAAADHFDMREAGTDPEQVSANTVTGTGRFYTADISVFNLAPDIPAEDRLLPVNAPGTASSQARQVSRIVDRIRELHGGDKVIVVAHSVAGLAARAAVTSDGDDSRVMGLITVGTPHRLDPLPWLADANAVKLINLIERMVGDTLSNAIFQGAIEQLTTFINNEIDWPQFPLQAFVPDGPFSLPTGVTGLMLATRLPSVASLRDLLLEWLQARVGVLQADFESRADVTHVGFGLRFTPPVPDAAVRVETTVRVDVARVQIVSGAVDTISYPPVPALTVSADVTRPGGWLVGDIGENPRLRWMQIGAKLTLDNVYPVVHLYDGYLDGVALVHAQLQALTGNSYSAPAAMNRLLNAAFEELTQSVTPNADFVRIAQTLEYFGLTQPINGGYGVSLDAWGALLANPLQYTKDQLDDLAGDTTQLRALLDKVKELLKVEPAGALDALLTLLVAQPGDTPAEASLRWLLGTLTGGTGEALGLVQMLLELLSGDVTVLSDRADALLNDSGMRAQALQFLRTQLNLNDVSQPEIDEVVFGLLRLRVTSVGLVELCLANPVPLADDLLLDVCITLDLQNPELRVRTLLRYTRVQVALAVTYERRIAGDVSRWLVELDWSHPEFPAPYEPLALYPPSPDLLDRLQSLVPRFVLSSFAATFIEQKLLAVNPDAAQLFSALGLAHRATPTAPWKIRGLDALIVQPRAWLTSTFAVGGPSLTFDPGRVTNLLQSLGRMAGVMSGSTIQLPYNMVATVATSGTQVNIAVSGAVTLPGGGVVTPNFTLSLNQDLQVGAGGGIDLNIPLPTESGWNAVIISSAYDDDSFSLSIGSDTTTIPLIPFNGFDSALFDLAGDAAFKLLPVLLEAITNAIGDDASSFATTMVNTANALGLNSVAALEAMVNDPVVWLRVRFVDSTAASQTATAVADLLSSVPGLSSSGGKLSIAITPEVTLEVGFENPTPKVGLWVNVTGLETGPMTNDLSAFVTMPTTGAISVDFGLALDMAVRPNIIEPAGVSIEPKLHFSQNGSTAFYVYPLGDQPGSPDFRMDILPTANFSCDDGGVPVDIADCLLAVVRNILVPLVAEVFLDSAPVTAWLNSNLLSGSVSTRPGPILVSAGLLESPSAGVFNLRPVNDIVADFSDGQAVLARLFGAALQAFEAQTIEIGSGDSAVNLMIVSDGTPKLYGLHLFIPEIEVSADPEIDIILGDGTTDHWVDGASNSPRDAESGITLYLVQISGSNFTFRPGLDLVDVGLTISGKNDDPLFDVSGFKLDAISARMFLSMRNLMTTPQITFGGRLALEKLGIPLGSFAGDNPIAGNLLSSDSGDGASVNPQFSIAVSYIDKLDIELEGGDSPEIWIPIQRSFGPVNIQQIGLRWEDPSETLSLLIDGGVSLEGLSVQLDDLSLSYSFQTHDFSLGLRGLGIGYNGGGVKIAGALVHKPNGDYVGLCLVEAAGKTFAAMGAYTQISIPGSSETQPSLFVFVVLPITIGGPPYFFILGISGGFGYNRDLIVPPVGDIPQFPLIAAAAGSGYITEEPLQVVDDIAANVPPAYGSYWFAVGLRFQSFALVDSVAMAYLLLNHGLEIGLLGVSTMELPPSKPLAVLEMALKVRFSTADGLFSVEAQLTENSWLLSRDCRLTGGFAFYLWFGGVHQGDFVITLGGYHPRFSKPAHFPDVPRLGFNWRVSSKIVIKGESYFALTTSAVMAGGLLEASYTSGALKAWFKVWADFLIEWKPFRYDIEIGVSIGASYRMKVNLLFGTITKTFKVELGASLHIWGPEFTGKAKVTWWVISFTVSFGANASKDAEILISWTEFQSQFLPEIVYKGDVTAGLLEDEDETVWKLKPEFILSTETAFAANSVQIGAGNHMLSAMNLSGVEAEDIDVRPVGDVDIMSNFKVDIIQDGVTVIATGSVAADTEYDETTFRDESGGSYKLVKTLVYRSKPQFNNEKIRFEIVRNYLPAALWDRDSSGESAKAEAKKIPAIVGVRVDVHVDEELLRQEHATGQIPVGLVEVGDIEHPLPFHVEINVRPQVGVLADSAFLLTQFEGLVAKSQGILGATRVILGTPQWQQRRKATITQLQNLGASLDLDDAQQIATATIARKRSAPPQIVSLYEGLAPETQEDVDLVEITLPTPPPVLVRRRVPQLTAVLRQRAEPTQPRLVTQRTTVFNVNEQSSFKRVSVANLPRVAIGGSALKRIAHPQAASPTRSTHRSAVFVRDRSARVDQLQEFESIQSRSVLPRQIVNINRLRMVDTHFRSSAAARDLPGVTVQAGTTQVWTIPATNAVGGMPEIAFTGDQALRITALNKADELLLDVEVYGTGRYALPPKTARVIVTGLGRPVGVSENLIPSMGAITLHQATQPVAVAGWQHNSQLIQVSQNALLGRGALLRVGTALPSRRKTRPVYQSLMTGGKALAGQIAQETWLPAGVNTIGIMVESHGTTGGDIADTLALGVLGANLSEKPLIVLGGPQAVLLYAVRDVRDPRRAIRIATASKLDWQLTGVIGMVGSVTYWSGALATQDLDTLVENGPLTPNGRSRVAFLVDEAPQPDSDLDAIDEFDHDFRPAEA